MKKKKGKRKNNAFFVTQFFFFTYSFAFPVFFLLLNNYFIILTIKKNRSLKQFFWVFWVNPKLKDRTQRIDHLKNSIRVFFSLLNKSLLLKYEVRKAHDAFYFFIPTCVILVFFGPGRCCSCSWSHSVESMVLFFFYRTQSKHLTNSYFFFSTQKKKTPLHLIFFGQNIS